MRARHHRAGPSHLHRTPISHRHTCHGLCCSWCVTPQAGRRAGSLTGTHQALFPKRG